MSVYNCRIKVRLQRQEVLKKTIVPFERKVLRKIKMSSINEKLGVIRPTVHDALKRKIGIKFL